MTVRLLFFSTLRKRFGFSETECVLTSPRPAREIFAGLFDDPREAASYLGHVRFAINCEYVSPEALVRPGDEVAIIPPVSGG